MNDFETNKIIIEEKSGFKCFEDMPGQQHVWYGLSSNFDIFKSEAENILITGDAVFFMDTMSVQFYDKSTNTFYS